VTLFEEMPGSEPSFLPAAYAPAARALHLRHYEPALASLRSGWAADPMNTDPAAASGSLLAGAAALRDGRWPDAITAFESAGREFPRSSESRRLLGTVYWMNGEPAKAIEQLQSAIAINANDERSRITLADVLVAGNRMTSERVLRRRRARCRNRAGALASRHAAGDAASRRRCASRA
jgi:tetratricopeptide (TPR) repeat protein